MGPNCWNFLEIFFGGRFCTVHVGAVWVDLCINLCFGMYRAGNGRENPGSLSEPMFCDFPGIVNEGFTIPGTVF